MRPHTSARAWQLAAQAGSGAASGLVCQAGKGHARALAPCSGAREGVALSLWVSRPRNAGQRCIGPRGWTPGPAARFAPRASGHVPAVSSGLAARQGGAASVVRLGAIAARCGRCFEALLARRRWAAVPGWQGTGMRTPGQPRAVGVPTRSPGGGAGCPGRTKQSGNFGGGPVTVPAPNSHALLRQCFASHEPIVAKRFGAWGRPSWRPSPCSWRSARFPSTVSAWALLRAESRCPPQEYQLEAHQRHASGVCIQ